MAVLPRHLYTAGTRASEAGRVAWFGRVGSIRGMSDHTKFSLLTLLRRTMGGTWREQWRDPDPRPGYDVVIVGAGGHGLATAYYLAKEHGISNVAVLDKGY